jgi:hypothetical protein
MHARIDGPAFEARMVGGEVQRIAVPAQEVEAAELRGIRASAAT